MRGAATIKALEDVPAEEMLRFRYKDGREAAIWEKWIEMSPNYMVFWNRWDPGALSPHHGHHGDHGILILEGEIRSRDGQVAKAGDHIMLEYGDQFGPWVAGPEGCTMYGWVHGWGGGGWAYAGDEEVFTRFLEELGAEMVPSPRPKRLPHWYVERAKNFGRKWDAT